MKQVGWMTVLPMLGLSLGLSLGPGLAGSAEAQRGPARQEWIDTHFHLIADRNADEAFEAAAQEALKIMDADGLRTAIIMSPPRPRENFDVESIAGVVRKHSPRMVMMGGGGSLNPMLQAAGTMPVVSEAYTEQFRQTAEAILAQGARGFGEITAHHLSLTPSHGYEWVPPDHPLLLLLADIAASHQVPIDLHFDPVPEDVNTPSFLNSPQNPAVLKANLPGFERLLAHNRKATFVWAHAGSDPLGYFTPALVRAMLGRHANLMLSVRPVNPRPGSLLTPKGPADPDWMALLRDFSERFVLGTDTFVVADSYSGVDAPRVLAQRSAIQRQGVRRLLSRVPPDVARRIAIDNAERIYWLR